MNAKIEWNTNAASADTAPVGQKLLNTVVPLYNDLLDARAKYVSATDTDGAVKALMESAAPDSEIGKLAKQIAQAKAMIERNTLEIEKLAKAQVTDDPNFDEDKAKAQFKDARAELKKRVDSIYETFGLLGFLEEEKDNVGKVVSVKANNDDAKVLLEIVKLPTLGSAGGSTSSVSNPIAPRVREWAMDKGLITNAKGKIATDVYNQFYAAHKDEFPNATVNQQAAQESTNEESAAAAE